MTNSFGDILKEHTKICPIPAGSIRSTRSTF